MQGRGGSRERAPSASWHVVGRVARTRQKCRRSANRQRPPCRYVGRRRRRHLCVRLFRPHWLVAAARGVSCRSARRSRDTPSGAEEGASPRCCRGGAQGRGRCSPGERESAVYGRGSQLNAAEWWGFERREGQPRSTSTAARDSVASRASSRRLVPITYVRTVVRNATRFLFFFFCRVPKRADVLVVAVCPDDLFVIWCARLRERVSRPRVSAIPYRKCSLMHGFVREWYHCFVAATDIIRERKKKCAEFPGISFADEPKSVVEKKKWYFRRVQPTARARIDRKRCWRPARISISVLNTSRRYLLRLVYRFSLLFLRRYLRGVHYLYPPFLFTSRVNDLSRLAIFQRLKSYLMTDIS